jgi:hypothetical protein
LNPAPPKRIRAHTKHQARIAHAARSERMQRADAASVARYILDLARA